MSGQISVSFNMDFSPLKAFLDRVDAEMDAAVAAAVRTAAQTTQTAARKRAPVLTGRLRNSITSSRVWTSGGGTFNAGVGPRGYAHLYAQKEERRHPYMEPAVKEAQAALDAALEDTAGKVWR